MTGSRRSGDSSAWLKRLIDVWTYLSVVVVVVALIALTTFVLQQQRQIADLNQRQIAAVQHQNDLQICAQHDMLEAIKKIGLKLGLPVRDIHPPDTEGLDCAP